MRMSRLISFVSIFALALVHSLGCTSKDSCPSGDCDPFPTFQDCYDEHHMTENFSTPRAIEICCIDHPIGSSAMNVVCGDTSDSCSTYVTANLVDSNDANLSSDIATACMDYVPDSGRGG
jgi:hypothetical protein